MKTDAQQLADLELNVELEKGELAATNLCLHALNMGCAKMDKAVSAEGYDFRVTVEVAPKIPLKDKEYTEAREVSEDDVALADVIYKLTNCQEEYVPTVDAMQRLLAGCRGADFGAIQLVLATLIQIEGQATLSGDMVKDNNAMMDIRAYANAGISQLAKLMPASTAPADAGEVKL